jgi:murein DD-endopeptidase MepM/ murein hydrolase activator NlpD
MTAEEYIRQEFNAGRFTLAHIEALVRFFQKEGAWGLVVDGKPGERTRHALREMYPGLFELPPFLYHPLPRLADGRMPVITSGFGPRGAKHHDGVDLFYSWRAGDKPDFVGDGGCEGRRDGKPAWVVPYGTEALAAADGVVQMSGPSATGNRIWIDHGNGWRSGYFHLEQLYAMPAGTRVRRWQPLGLVGHNPVDTDGRHLHFEVSPVEKYAPVDPQKYLIKW